MNKSPLLNANNDDVTPRLPRSEDPYPQRVIDTVAWLNHTYPDSIRAIDVNDNHVAIHYTRPGDGEFCGGEDVVETHASPDTDHYDQMTALAMGIKGRFPHLKVERFTENPKLMPGGNVEGAKIDLGRWADDNVDFDGSQKQPDDATVVANLSANQKLAASIASALPVGNVTPLRSHVLDGIHESFHGSATRHSLPEGPKYINKLMVAGRAAIKMMFDTVEYEVENGNRNNIPGDIQTWYLHTMCALLSEMEHQHKPQLLRVGMAVKIRDAIRHFDRKNKTKEEGHAAAHARHELLSRETPDWVVDRTYEGLIPG